MLFTAKGALSTQFLQFAAASFYYTTGYGFSLFLPEEKLEAYEPYTDIPEPYEGYLMEKLKGIENRLSHNKVKVEYWDHQDAVLLYPIAHKGTYLGTVVAGPLSIQSSRNEGITERMKVTGEALEDTMESLIRTEIMKDNLSSSQPEPSARGTESRAHHQHYHKRLPVIEQFQIQYLTNLLNLILSSTYYDPTEISSLPISDAPSYRPLSRNVSTRIIHHSIDQEEKILTQILTSKDTFTKLAAKHISKLSNLVAPPLADDPIRSEKNRFIVSATIVARAAIKLGMPSDLAFSYSDHFINRIESCDTLQKIWDLQMSLFSFYREEVKKIKEKSYFGSTTSLLLYYIEDHIDTTLSLQEICETLSVDYKYASRAFKKDTGSGFNKYLTKQKMQRAKKLLETTEDSISSIAENLGYSSAYYFTRTFKSTYGLSPSEYRKRMLSE